jgi:hypothetical protein
LFAHTEGERDQLPGRVGVTGAAHGRRFDPVELAVELGDGSEVDFARRADNATIMTVLLLAIDVAIVGKGVAGF